MIYKHVYNLLIKKQASDNTRWWQFLWNKFVGPNHHREVETTIHGVKVFVNCGYTYPIYARRFSNFNNPLLQIAFQTYTALGRKISVIDVGAAVGDTVLLLEGNMFNAFEKMICVEGDKEFFSYLRKNMQNKTNVYCLQSLLSDKNTTAKKLVRIHSGTASAQGEETVPAKTLDTLLVENNLEQRIDLLKIDVDGFDGNVLSGATQLLSNSNPNVIFEWHPIMYAQTGNDIFKPFYVLKEHGYTDLLFYTKYGTFSHLMHTKDLSDLSFYADLAQRNNHDYDWHYDVIALPHNTIIDKIELAELTFAKNRQSRF